MKFYIHKLGCPKNDVDGDYIAARLVEAGHEPVMTPEEADSIIVNTCGFILPAKEESIGEILRLGRLKKEGRLRTLYASGCLTQGHGNELLRGMPELDGAFGHGTLDAISQAVTESRRHDRFVGVDTRKLAYLDWHNRLITDDLPYAYLKISDGCDRGCAYCTIPALRGSYRSRPMESILREANFLAANGKKELILVSQEATLYGYDLPDRPGIMDLLKELDKIDAVTWLRLMYLYPAQLSYQLIDYLVSGNKTLDYFDLPLQHINSRILKTMRRQGDRPTVEKILERIRSRSSEATLRTTLIVGFPGETEQEFTELLEFVAEGRFDRLGAFPYSREEQTPAAAISAQIPEDVKLRRLDELMTLQHDIAVDKNNSLIGSVKEVIIDTPTDGTAAVGRTRADCPDIDQVVHVAGREVKAGDMLKVRIDAADAYDLKGTVVEG
ncbi:MAG: 30S ribosomal protein S12 methylthiotransferase RimO [candidate division Zixibacteria bacterium]|nr:30S ribosomal protein S12 methylthiotransferase RimO [candidate division Zixibacteria bacterium]